MRLLSPELHDDDGVDARTYFSREREKNTVRADGRVRSLVERCVHDVLMGDINDPRLRDLVVEEIRFAPDASRFRAVILVEEGRDPHAVEEALNAAQPVFRCALAEALQRKRTPQLVFTVTTRREP